MALPVAYINNYPLPYYMNSLLWTYELNTSSYDTVGGRVIQVLSVKIDTLELEGEAGSRPKLISLFQNIQTLQNQQIQTQNPATLSVPGRGWSFRVWVRAFPQFGWNVQTVTYPYKMSFEVDEQFGSLESISQDSINGAMNAFARSTLKGLAPGIGFNTAWTGQTTAAGNTLLIDPTSGLSLSSSPAPQIKPFGYQPTG